MPPKSARTWQQVDGLLLLDKPSGISSNAALQQARRLLNAARAGHTGTLDPLASGLLPLCCGVATRFATALLHASKSYTATLRLGETTNSGDADGTVIQQRPVTTTRAQLEAALEKFRGPLLQTPPRYSALKRNGKPLYAYARAGIEIELAARPVHIHQLELLEWQEHSCVLQVQCSHGAYIRSLANDLGEALGCGAHLSALRRAAVGPFSLHQAHSLTALENLTAPARQNCLLPADALLMDLQRLDLDAQQAQALAHGKRLQITHAALFHADAAQPLRLRVYAPHNQLLGTALLHSTGLLQVHRLVNTSTLFDTPAISPEPATQT